MSAFRSMLPVITKVTKIMQGNVNHDALNLARKNQTKQYMVMLGKITKQDLLDEYDDSPIPMWLDPAYLPSIDRLQVGWWEEMHIKKEGEKRMHNNLQIRFPRNAAGRYDPLSNKIKPVEYKASYKYTN